MSDYEQLIEICEKCGVEYQVSKLCRGLSNKRLCRFVAVISGWDSVEFTFDEDGNACNVFSNTSEDGDS